MVGRRLRVGAKAVVAVTERDPRCRMVTLDPDTARRDPEVLRAINRAHANKAGVYGAVLVEGTVRPGDDVALADWGGTGRRRRCAGGGADGRHPSARPGGRGRAHSADLADAGSAATMPAQIGPATEEGAMRVLHVNGYGMAYPEHGAGTPPLLVHGSLLDQRYRAPRMEPLEMKPLGRTLG